jgi:hypothetical protein
MGRKTSFLIGLGAGYVLGARAGRQRYEEIARWWNQLTGNPTIQRAAGRTKDLASDGAKRGLSVVQQGVEKAGDAVKSRLHMGDRETDMLIAELQEGPGRAPEANPTTARDAFRSGEAET